ESVGTSRLTQLLSQSLLLLPSFFFLRVQGLFASFQFVQSSERLAHPLAHSLLNEIMHPLTSLDRRRRIRRVAFSFDILAYRLPKRFMGIVQVHLILFVGHIRRLGRWNNPRSG